VLEFVSRRYESGSLLLASNKTFPEWAELLGDDLLAAANLTAYSTTRRCSRLAAPRIG
jgi:DNA replication protein DnaC